MCASVSLFLLHTTCPLQWNRNGGASRKIKLGFLFSFLFAISAFLNHAVGWCRSRGGIIAEQCTVDQGETPRRKALSRQHWKHWRRGGHHQQRWRWLIMITVLPDYYLIALVYYLITTWLLPDRSEVIGCNHTVLTMLSNPRLLRQYSLITLWALRLYWPIAFACSDSTLWLLDCSDSTRITLTLHCANLAEDKSVL